MMTMEKMPERDEIESLLPWHAAGTLSRRDAERVERALTEDKELARRFELVREELGETIHLNETLGAPSARAYGKLFAAIAAEPGKRKAHRFDFDGWIAEKLSAFSPRTLAWSAAAAVLAIALQAGLLAGMFVSERGGIFETASRGDTAIVQGSYALVRFNGGASAAAITKFLETHKAVLVDGPKAGGIYRVKVAPIALSKGELAQVLERMRADTAVVASVLSE